ncbi:MAG: pantoate--beta-alanine ligase [Planctomycetes bacterium]|nr:pantoate--beta-alanine ligase [Planctomycetota bacterium]
MIVARTRDELRSFLASRGGAAGFVPTMGALHEGHFSLIRRAKADCATTVVSVFVNPKQFNDPSDLANYPRTDEADIKACEKLGVDAVLFPSVEEMYPADFRTTVTVHGLTDNLCGASRPGHFAGVTTVVARLFGIVGPCAAYFGQKDFQQAMVIRRMTEDLALPVKIVVCPILREADGLAMSSRNVRLTKEQRKKALCLRRGIKIAAEMIRHGAKGVEDIVGAAKAEIAKEVDVRLDYLKIVSVASLLDVQTVEDEAAICGAVYLGEVRLIDNAYVRRGVGELDYDV